MVQFQEAPLEGSHGRAYLQEWDLSYDLTDKRMRFEPDSFIDVGELVGLPKGELRQIGHTSHQIRTAPANAVFVWCNDQTHYARDLARHLGREDLTIKPADWIMRERNILSCDQRIVLDHALFHPSSAS